tara:strand:- start:131 stop:718 length:588 start_codon:yes stop_codon:yes gene_type:complete
MKRLLLILILTFSFHSLTKADDIRDFEIEGMSIGDSLLDYFNKEEILKNKYYAYSNKSYFQTFFILPDSNKYTSIQVNIKDGSTNFIIESIEGGIHPINFDECKQEKNKIENELKSIFNNLEIVYEKEKPMQSDPTGLSIGITTNLLFGKTFTDGPAIRIMCVDRSKKIEEEKGWVDSLRVVINSKEFNNFIQSN